MKKTVLIFGITSFVGSNLAEVLSQKYKVVGTYFREREYLPQDYTMVRCDVLNKDEIAKAVHFFRPDYVIYAVGESSLVKAKLSPKISEALNTNGALNCLTVSERAGALFIYLSSAYVFSGENKLFKEADTPFSHTVYGTAVANTEFLIQRSSMHYLILRCPVLYGLGFSTSKKNLFEIIQESHFEGKKVKLDNSVELGFLDIHLVGRFLMALLDKGVLNRLLQITTKDYMTIYQFAQKYADVFGQSKAFFEPVTDLFPQDAKHGGNLCFKMDISNTESRIGIMMPTIEETLEFTCKRLSEKSS